MLRVLNAGLRGTARAVTSASIKSADGRIPSTLTRFNVLVAQLESKARYFSALQTTSLTRDITTSKNYGSLFSASTSSNILMPNVQGAKVPVRTLIKYTRYKGKRKTVRTVLRRFYRLNWGIWIRTKAGRQKRLWKKTIKRKQRLRRHVFTTASQSHLLDTMVCKYWRRPTFFVDDPYNPYHQRESFYKTRKYPRVV